MAKNISQYKAIEEDTSLQDYAAIHFEKSQFTMKYHREQVPPTFHTHILKLVITCSSGGKKFQFQIGGVCSLKEQAMANDY